MSTAQRVANAVMDCEGVAFDGCHKVYVLMDKEQVEKMRGYGYGVDTESDGSYLLTTDDHKRSELLTIVKEWYRKSCSLKFIQSIATVPGDEEGDSPQDEYDNLIPQGGYWR